MRSGAGISAPLHDSTQNKFVPASACRSEWPKPGQSPPGSYLVAAAPWAPPPASPANRKTSVGPGGGFPFDIDIVHPRGRWPVLTPIDHFSHGLFVTLECRFQTAIAQVAHPAADIELARLPYRVIAEVDTLDSSRNGYVRCCIRQPCDLDLPPSVWRQRVPLRRRLLAPNCP